MPVSAGYKEFLEDLLASFGPVGIRNMFSGAGVYADGVMFAILMNDTLYLKADGVSARDFAAKGKAPLASRRKGRRQSPCPTGRCRSACSTIRRSWSPGQGARMPWHSLLKPSRSADPGSAPRPC